MLCVILYFMNVQSTKEKETEMQFSQSSDWIKTHRYTTVVPAVACYLTANVQCGVVCVEVRE